MDIPLWAFFGLVTAILSAGVFLVQERVELDGFSMAFWNKAACAFFTFPMVLIMGMPENPWFYGLLVVQSLLWAISDVIFFNAIPKVGAGPISRILPASVILTFCLWFVIDPSVFHEYLDQPIRSALVFLVLCVSVYFAMNLRRCSISLQTVRLVWFVIFASVVGPLLTKLVVQHASFVKAPFAYVFFQALMMMAMWLIYYTWRRPVALQSFLSIKSIKAGFAVGAFSCMAVSAHAAAIFVVDNPGLIPAITVLDSVVILLYYRLIKHKEKSDVISGIGIALCAAAIIILKSF